MRTLSTAILLACLTWTNCVARSHGTPDAAVTTYVPVHTFDAARDAAADIRAAIAEARKTQKRIILYVGGPWCMYCSQMDQFFQENPDLLQLRESRFITVKVYYGSGQSNQQALSPYTKMLGVPHFYVLESDGTLLYSQHVLELRADGGYSPVKFREFLQRWARPDSLPLTDRRSNTR